jgi:hypothetical protein
VESSQPHPCLTRHRGHGDASGRSGGSGSTTGRSGRCSCTRVTVWLQRTNPWAWTSGLQRGEEYCML